VSSLIALTAATVGGPLIKTAGFSAAVKVALGALEAEKARKVSWTPAAPAKHPSSI
jgi:hypothetical protein